MIYKFLQKYHLTIDDYYDLAAIGLCKAAITFNDTKSAFSTYAYKCMYTSVMMDLRKKTQAKTIPEHQILYYQAEVENNDGDTAMLINYIPSKDNVEDNVLSEVLFDEFAKKLKKEKHRLIFELFREGYNQRQIGKMVGCSQPQVSRIKKKLIEYLAN